jgi:hypothetical protein
MTPSRALPRKFLRLNENGIESVVRETTSLKFGEYPIFKALKPLF